MSIDWLPISSFHEEKLKGEDFFAVVREKWGDPFTVHVFWSKYSNEMITSGVKEQFIVESYWEGGSITDDWTDESLYEWIKLPPFSDN